MRVRILLTGGSGFLGKTIQHHFLNHPAVDLVTLSGRKDFDRLEKLSESSFNVIIHAGFQVDFSPYRDEAEPSESIKNTERLIAFAEKTGKPHFIFLSAAAVLGVSDIDSARSEDSFGETDTDYREYSETRYVHDKIECQRLLENYSGLSTTLFLTTVYGPGMPDLVLKPLRALRGPLPVAVCPPGGTSFLDWRDFLEAMDSVISKKIGGSFTISSGNATFQKLFCTAATVMGVRYRKIPVRLSKKFQTHLTGIASALNTKLGKGPNAALLAASFGYKYYTPIKAKRVLGWKPKRTLLRTLESVLS